ncbi:MAG TPA: quinol:electron acceptor oxidoreductase subunit ActD, partial [Nannocystis sp.]
VAMLARNGLPRPYHPLFSVPAFERASQDRFFLAIAASDPRFRAEEVRAFLRDLEPLEVHDVPG